MTLQLGTLNEAALSAFTLSLLGDGSKSREEISQSASILSGGRINWTEGTFLPVLFKLEHQGLIQSAWIKDDYGNRTKIYIITNKGKQEILKEQDKWETMYSILGGLLDMRIQRNYLPA